MKIVCSLSGHRSLGIKGRHAIGRIGRGSPFERANLQICNATRYLLVPNGDGNGDHINLTFEGSQVKTIQLVQGAFEVGREPETAEICLPIPTVSGRHALLRLDEQNVLSVTDLGSTNGTYLNGKELEPQQEINVNVQDEIIFGDSHLASFVFVEDEESAEDE